VITSATEKTTVEAIRNRMPRSGEGADWLEGSRGAAFVRAAGEIVINISKKRLVRGRNEPQGLKSGGVMGFHKIPFWLGEKCKDGTWSML
jgi:hypothetical protein